MDEKFYERMYQANVKLVDENSMLKDYTSGLEKRIDKAIEYIENPRHEMSVKSYQELLEILKGESYE